MAVERAPGGPSLIDVLDRVLDKGIVIDAWARVSLVGIDMITIESLVRGALFNTYLNYSDPLRRLPSVASPRGTSVEEPSSLPAPALEKEKPPPRGDAMRAARARK